MSIAYVNNTLYVKNESVNHLVAERDYSAIKYLIATPLLTAASYYVPYFGTLVLGAKTVSSAINTVSDFKADKLSYSTIAKDVAKTAAWGTATAISATTMNFGDIKTTIKSYFSKAPIAPLEKVTVDAAVDNTATDAFKSEAAKVVAVTKGFFDNITFLNMPTAEKYFSGSSFSAIVVGADLVYNGAKEVHAYNEALEEIAINGTHTFVIDDAMPF